MSKCIQTHNVWGYPLEGLSCNTEFTSWHVSGSNDHALEGRTCTDRPKECKHHIEETDSFKVWVEQTIINEKAKSTTAGKSE